MLVEPFAGDAVSDNVGPIGRLYYSASTTLCVPHSRSEDIGLALGAQAGPARLAAVLEEAGFRCIRTAYETPVQHRPRGPALRASNEKARRPRSPSGVVLSLPQRRA